MCGIAGVAGELDLEQAARGVTSMLAALARRGPDGEGIEAWNRAVLGHRRLAIFDLSDAGRQPMCSPDRRIAVTFNGAIYNFVELRAQLAVLGYRFSSRSDTEVLVHGYDAWGIDTLVSKLHGMFAFALWDDRAETLYLVRDRLGVKPLLYEVGDGVLAFASTARALNVGGFGGGVSAQALGDFLEFGFVPDRRSIFSGIEKLPAAHIARWHRGRLDLRRYWNLTEPVDGHPSFADAVDEAEHLLLRAVQLRLEADVPVGALLSGGIDSALVCWAIRKLGGDITAFTVATPGDEYDESEDAIATAKELGIRHCVLPVDADSAPSVDELTSAYGEPFACASALGMLAISQAVKQRATVLLTGEGGDDVFLGYPRHAHYAASSRLATVLPRASTGVWDSLRPFVPQSGMLRRAVHFMDYATGGLGAIEAVAAKMPYYSSHSMLGRRLSVAVKSRAGRQSRSIDSARRALEDFLEYERSMRFVGEYMTKVDGGTMYYALEARAPLLDQDLWNFASSLPYDLRLRGGELKAVLRGIARRRIGRRVASGSKRGFGVPVERWLTTRWRKDFENAFEDSVLDRDGWIDARAVLRAHRSLDTGETAPQQLWYLYVLEHWMRKQKPVEHAAMQIEYTAPASQK